MLLNPLESRRLLSFAVEKHFAILALNADSPSCVLDGLEAARACRSPIIIETSLWQLEGRSFGAGDPLRGMARYIADLCILAESEPFRDIPVLYHTDHIKGPKTLDLLTKAIQGLPVRMAGMDLKLSPSTISLDSSELKDEENIAYISALAQAAKDSGRAATFEMEAGVDEGLTPPEVVKHLVGGVEAKHPGALWLFAPGVGSRHGLSDKGFPEFSPDHVGTNKKLLKEITGRDLGIALHGSSGLPDSSLGDAVAQGVTKVNWSSESLLMRSEWAREYYLKFGDHIRAGDSQFKATAMDNGVQSYVSARYVPKVVERMRLLGGEGMADRWIPSPTGGRDREGEGA